MECRLRIFASSGWLRWATDGNAAAPGEVVIRVAACGIRGSDLHEYLHGPLYIPKTPHPLTGVVPPVTLGHEFCGRVVLVGLVPETVQTNLLGLLAHEKEIVGSSAYVDEFPEAIDLLGGQRVRIDPLVTARVSLDEALPRGLEALLRREEKHVKILVAPN